MSHAPRLGRYDSGLGSEATIARGPADGRALLIVQPLFEEAGFTRGFVTDLACALADRGVTSWLVDLPGQGDSLTPLATVRLADWRAATRAAIAHVAAAAGHVPHVATIRGGALLVDRAWRLAPCNGPALLRPLRRAAALGESAGIGGWPIAPPLAADLDAATLPAPDPATRDVAWPGGVPPWRRAEPGRDPAVSTDFAADIATWMTTCAAR